MAIASQTLPSVAGIFSSTASSHQNPPTAKNRAPLAISLLSAEAPMRFSELNARSGEPRCITEARKPMPINSQIKNILRTSRRRASRWSPSASQPRPLTMVAPTTH